MPGIPVYQQIEAERSFPVELQGYRCGRAGTYGIGRSGKRHQRRHRHFIDGNSTRHISFAAAAESVARLDSISAGSKIVPFQGQARSRHPCTCRFVAVFH